MKTGRDSDSMDIHLWESSAARNWSCKAMDVDLIDMPCQAPSTGRSVDFGLIKAMAKEL